MDGRPEPLHQAIPWIRRLSSKLGWAFSLALALILTVVGVGLIKIAEQGQKKLLCELQIQDAREVARHISDYIDNAVDDLVFFNSLEPLALLTPQEQRDGLDRILIQIPYKFSELSLINSRGEETAKVSLSHAYLVHELKNVAGEAWFQEAIQGAIHVGSVQPDIIEGGLFIPMALPLPSRNGDEAAVLTARLNLAPLWERISRSKISRKGSAYIVDAKGRLVAHQNPSYALQNFRRDMSSTLPVNRYLSGESTTGGGLLEYTGLDGREAVGVFVQVEAADWAVVVELPRSEAFAGVRFMKQYLTGLMALGVLATLALTFLALRRTIASINTLSNHAAAIAKGDLSRRVFIKGKDEISNLALAFDSMRIQLKDLIETLEHRVAGRTRELSNEVASRREAEASLQRAHDELGLKVRQRTAELEASNSALTLEIAEHVKTAQALRESEQRFRGIADHMPQVVFETDSNGTLTFVNQNAHEVFGYTPEDVAAGMNAMDTIAPEDWERAADNMLQRAAKQVSGVRQYTAMRKDGARFPMEVHSYPIYKEGAFMGLRGLIVDLTEHKKAEKRLADALTFVEKIIAESPVGISIFDSSGVCISANQAIADILGMPMEQVLGRNYHDREGWKNSGLYDVAQAAIREDAPKRHRTVTQTGLGKPIVVDCYVVPFEFGEEPQLMVMAIDVQEQVKALEEVARLRNLLSNIVNSMPSVLVGVDLDGRVTQWNREAERVTGVSAEEAHNQPVTQVFPRLAQEMEKVREAIAMRRPQTETRLPHQVDGETCFSDVTVFPLVSNGVRGAVIRIDDVTERVRIEELMIQSEKMSSVGGLAAGMAHEINNPLAGIIQNAQVIAARISPDMRKNRETARECGVSMEAVAAYLERRGVGRMVESIRDSGVRAGQIVSNMLSFSRKSQSAFAPTDVNRLLDQTVELASSDYDLKKKYDFKQIKIVREYDPDLPLALCEAGKIQQVLLNLLRNAAHAMAAGSGSRKAPVITLRTLKRVDGVLIEVEDNGPGMDEKTRKRIFEPFFTTKGVGAGTGLGLSVSYFIITEDHGGTMSVDSSTGNGARFFITLPLDE